ncbi:MAG: helix-hairpin-helix domain-containing protein [Bacteroidota bacterium]
MKTSWKDYFYFTARERSGLLVLLGLGLLLVLLPVRWRAQFPRPRPTTGSFENEVHRLLRPTPKATSPSPEQTDRPPIALFPFDPNQVSSSDLERLGLSKRVTRNLIRYREKGGQFRRAADFRKIYGLSEATFERLAPYLRFPSTKPQTGATPYTPTPVDTSNTGSESSPIVLQDFDPNQATKSELRALGLPPRTAQTILNFREKGGTFRRKSDLQKIYGMTEALYDQLEPYLQIAKDSSRRTTPQPPPPPVRVDVNQASAADWQRLRGVGPYFAGKIVSWRDKLGGFYDIEQVATTAGLPDSTFQRIRPQLDLSPILRPIPVNKSSVEDLRRHPYLSYKQAQILFRYRQNHGKIENWAAFDKIRGFDAQQRERLRPYLNFD